MISFTHVERAEPLRAHRNEFVQLTEQNESTAARYGRLHARDDTDNERVMRERERERERESTHIERERERERERVSTQEHIKTKWR